MSNTGGGLASVDILVIFWTGGLNEIEALVSERGSKELLTAKYS